MRVVIAFLYCRKCVSVFRAVTWRVTWTDLPNKLGELDARCSSLTPKLSAIVKSVQYLRVSLNFRLSWTLWLWIAMSWFCRNCTFVASVRLVSWNTSQLLSSVSVSDKLLGLPLDSSFTSKPAKSSVDVDLSSVLVLVISSVDVETLFVEIPTEQFGVWFQSLSARSLPPLYSSSPFDKGLFECPPISGSLGCSLWSESNVTEFWDK